MKPSFLLFLALLPLSVWAQSGSDTTTGNLSTSQNDSKLSDQSRMLLPPPVSAQPYPSTPISQSRSNYLFAGVTFNSAYTDNLLAGTSASPISDVSYSVWPTFSLDESTPRLHTTLTYSPGFSFYQRVSARNGAEHNVGADLQYRLGPHVTFSAHDAFQKSSNIFNQPSPFFAGVSGSPQIASITVIPPVADLLN